jgi:hypothetical protein
MSHQRQSRLESIVRAAKYTAVTLAFTLLPSTTVSTPDINPLKSLPAEAAMSELGKAHQLLLDFPRAYKIPGIKEVYKFENPEANFLLVYFSTGYHPKEEMSRSYRNVIINVNNDIYKAFACLQEKYNLKDVYKEAVTDENWLDYHRSVESAWLSIELKKLFDEMKRSGDKHLLPSRNVMRRFNRSYNEQIEELKYDIVKRIAVEKDVTVFPAEDAAINKKAGDLLRAAWSDDEIYREALDTVFRKRELQFLKEGTFSGDPLVVIFFGRGHARGLEESSLVKSIKEWNSDPENKYEQYCAVILTPEHYPEK